MKTGPGTLTFTGTNDYNAVSADTLVEQGNLVLNAGAFGVGIVHGFADATLGGTLTLQGSSSQPSFPIAESDIIRISAGSTLVVAGAGGATGYNQATYGGTIELTSSYTAPANVTTPDASVLLFGADAGGMVASYGGATNSFAANIVLKNTASVPWTVYAQPTNVLSFSGVISDFPGFVGNPVVYTGGGTVAVSGTNTYVGPTTMASNVVVSLSNLGNGGSAGNLGAAGNSAANLVFANGTLLYTGATAGTDRGFTIQAGATATFNIAANALTFSNTSPATSGGLVKTGPGTLVLAGTNSYNGTTSVSNGTLLVNGSLPSTAVSVPAGGEVGGLGLLGASLNVASAGILGLSVTPGVTNGLTVTAGTTLNGAVIVSPVYLGAALQPGTYTVLTGNGGIGGSYSLTWSDPTSQTIATGFILNGNKLQVTLAVRPLVTTLAAGSVTATNATLNGSVNPNGLGAATYFEYGADTNYGTIGGLNSFGGFSTLPAANTTMAVAGVVVDSVTGPAGLAWMRQNIAAVLTNYVYGYEWQVIVSSADGTHLAAADDGGDGAGILTSTNGGLTWNQPTNNLSAGEAWTSMASSADGTHLVAANGSGIIYSTNSGGAWLHSDMGSGNSWPAMAASADGTHIVAPIPYTGNLSYLGGIWASTNSGANWLQLTNSPKLNWDSIASSANGTFLAASAGSNIWTSADGGLTWTQHTGVPGLGLQALVSSADGSRLAGLIELGYGGIYTSTNRGVSWVLQNAPTNVNWAALTMSADGSRLAAVALNGHDSYNGITYTNGGIYTSADSGLSWTFQTNAPGTNSFYAIASSADGTRLAAGAVGYVWTSGGTTTALSPTTTYHYQLVGFNAVGTSLGGDQTFTTGVAAPAVTTAAASGINATTATLNGTVNPGGGATTAWFRYGLTTSYGSFSATNPLTAAITNLPLAGLISNLTPGTLYHYQLMAGNTAGTNAGLDATFTTIPAVPVVTTLAANLVTATNAALNGTVNPGGGATTAWFEYGLTTGYGSFSATNTLTANNSTLSVTNLINGLNPGSTYHYQLVAGNSSGTNHGVDLTFNTPAGPLTVATLAATGVTAITASLNGTVYPGGLATTAWFQYGLTTAYGSVSATNSVAGTNGTVPISNLISGLNPNSTYHFQVVAGNSAGTARGVDATFSTPVGALTVTTLVATAVTATNATLNGSVSPLGAPATAWFEYGPDTNYGHLGGFMTFPAANATLNMPGLTVASLAGPAGGDWQQTGPSYPFWQSIASSGDGTHLAAGANSGQLYTSTDSGVTWIQQTNVPNKGWESIASSADGTQLAALLYGGGIYTSTNSGLTWILQTNAPTADWESVASSADGTRLLAAAGYSTGLYLSTNSGVTWTQDAPAAISNYRWYSAAASADGTRLAAVSGFEGVWTSTNTGGAWIQQTNAPAQYWSSIVSSADGTRLAIASSETNLPVYTSTNGGTTWSPSASPALSWTSLASSADGTRLSALLSGNGIWTSTNGGATWSQGNAPSNTWTSLASSADGSRLTVASSGSGIWNSIGAVNTLNAAATYHYQLVGMNNSTNVLGGDLTFAPALGLPVTTTLAATGIGLATATLNGTVNPGGAAATAWFQYGTTTNYGSVTATVNLPGTNVTLAVSNLLSSLAAGTYHFQLVSANSAGTAHGGDLSFATASLPAATPVVTTLAATSITTSNAVLNGSVNPGDAVTAAWFEYGLTTNYGDIAGIISLPVTSTTMNLPGVVVQSVTGPAGATWHQAPTSDEYWAAIAASADGTHLVAVDNNGAGVWTSTNSGVTWSQTSAPDDVWVTVASSADGTRLTAVASGGDVWTSTSGGATWSQDNLPADNWYCLASSADGTRLTVGSSLSGIWASADGGMSWAQQTNAPASGYVWNAIASSADGTRLAAGAEDGGIWTSTNGGTTWLQRTNAPTSGYTWSGIASSADGTRLAATTYGTGIWTSTNSGVNWTQQTNAPIYVNWYSIASSADGSRLAAVVYYNSIWTSTDGGRTWAAQTGAPTSGYPWCSIASSADGTFLAAVDDNEGGVWTSTGAVTALAPGTTYHYQLLGFNRAGTGLGGDLTFTTGGTSANLSGNFNFKLGQTSGSGPFHLSFTNLTGLSFTVIGTTNLTEPVANWPVLGTMVESPVGSGQYQISDLPIIPAGEYFRVRSP